MLELALALMLAQPAPAPAEPAQAQRPDIELDARLTAQRVTVVNRGDVALTLRAEPDGGSRLDVEAPDLPQGQRELRNVELRVHAEALIADDLQAALDARNGEEPASPE
jgi:hemolysin activation/secretion protein